MNQKTTRFNQDSFVAPDALPGNVGLALSNDITSPGIRTEALGITSYTAGDTSGKPDNGLPEVTEANTPKRISRKYIPLQSSGGKSKDAVFPQNGDDADFAWRPQGFQYDAFVSVKDNNPVQAAVTQEKGGPSREVMGLLKQLGHSDAGEITQSAPSIVNNTIQEKAIVVNMSPTNLTNVEFSNYISSTSNDNRAYNQNAYSIQSDTVVNAGSVFVNHSSAIPRRKQDGEEARVNEASIHTTHKAATDKITTNTSSHTEESNKIVTNTSSQTEESNKTTQNNPEVSVEKIVGLSKDNNTQEAAIATEQWSIKAPPKQTDSSNHVQPNDSSTIIQQSDAEVYEQVRAILGENKQDWKQVIKTAKSTTNSTATSNTASGGNSTIANQEIQMEQVIQKVLSAEANSRVELEHVLTHKFSTELTNMQQSMNKKIQDLRETFNNFMMR